MGNWTLGRVGLDVVANSEDAPSTFTVSGDEVEFSGVLRAGNASDARFLRLQLNGYVDNVDEPVVPFYWSEDASEWDGFYRIVDASVGTVPMSLTAHWFPFTVKMVRVADGWQAPMIESRLLGALRANDHSVTNGSTQPWHAFPATTLNYDTGSTSSTFFKVTLTTSDGDVRFVYTTNGTVFMDCTPTYLVPPNDWYDGSARIELSGDGGTTYRAVTGRQIINLPTAWRLSNGLVRITPTPGASSGAKIDVSHFDGATWETAKTYRFNHDGSNVNATFASAGQSLTALCNSPEVCAVRLSSTADDIWGSATVDLSLRRGSRMVEGFVAGRSLSDKYGVLRDSVEASTNITGGVRASSNDASGNRYVIATPTAFTNNTVNGGLSRSAAGAFLPFAIGSEIGGSGATVPSRATDLISQYFAAVSDRQRVIQR